MASRGLFHELTGLALEHQTLISRFGRGSVVPVPHKTVHEAFESIVDAHPSTTAATHHGKTITYLELDVAANRLANHLIESGLRPKHRACLVVQRSFEMLIGILAILKAGCQYVPVDGGISSDQALQHILKDTDSHFVLCLPKFEKKVKRLAEKGVVTVLLGSDVEAFCSKDRPKVSVSPADGVYAIYTSGSTGAPKGVDVSHGNVTNALLLQPGSLGIGLGTRVAQVLNIAFDMGAWEIIACLMNGGTLYIRGSDWEETLRQVDVFISTPTILSKYRRSQFPNIKTVVSGGEPCPQSLADEWADSTFYYNICGPTEITILNSAHQHTPGQPLTIGKPLPNTNVYILDENENPVPFGGKGSMWVGGAGVTRGYINLPELTAKRYKYDKFLKDGSLMFNTGDIVRWREAGSLDTFGRLDDQVKIKGFRVELDGVTAVIEKFPGITRACAALIDSTLYGFYSTTTLIDEHDLDAFVRHHLPYYSVPAKWVYVASVPLSPNGKFDKKQLHKLAFRASRSPLARKETSTYATRDLYLPAKIRTDFTKDPEKGERSDTPVVISSHLSDFNVSSPSIAEKPETLPPKNGFHGQRWLRHRLFILYRRFFTVIVMANLAVACFILYRNIKDDRYMLADLATATAANLCVAVLMRSEPVINLLFTMFCSVPTSWPLAIRRHCARIFHIGGIHSGCAIASILWFSIFTIGASLEFGKPPVIRCLTLTSVVLTYLLWPFLIIIACMSHPSIRAKHHDAWEHSHRLGGWVALLLLWIQTMFVTRDLAYRISTSQAYLHSPPIWLLTITSIAVIFPWIFLRKVPVRSEVLSSHAIRLWFDYTTPAVGTSVRLAERPLGDWHGFATITNPNGKGFSLVVSNAGDFTKRTISRAPSHIYVRGIPACGVLRIATLFKSVVLVATGSGIGPCLAVILAKKIPCRILWTAPNPEQTFGKEIIDSVLDCDPKAVIHNTRTQGKPNMNLLAYQLWKESGAEAVCVISNKTFTTRIVYAMETRGIPAYGAIFDS
ncbi:acetyl-CoA synthetase-like protein [Lentithecium fluviatile CBS 122367]|uniref:Acetyl-CoA synthetase-like protein n=1 Tax=Lentithecium fluviatile CBS 122367 TaxID=1168545 RepID=A0A6G1IZ92_9PLEO|nr:acetyl-CoA synthetase-like protein [Lentithecium fluviatile CBS 122367]